MKIFFSILFLTGCCFPLAAELPDVVAKFGNTELKKSRFSSRQLPADPAERNRTLKKWVDTEVCLLIVRSLLDRSGIAPAAPAAQRYTALRKSQLGESKNSAFIASLEKQISHPDFCLKAALYFTFYAAVPSSVEPSEEEIRLHYSLNREKFRTPVQHTLAFFKVGAPGDANRKQAKNILARLKQGEDFYALAKQFDPQGREAPSRTRPYDQKYLAEISKLAPGESSFLETPEGIFIVKVQSKKESSYLPLTEVRPYIREVLSGRKLKETLEQYIREILAKTPVIYNFQVP